MLKQADFASWRLNPLWSLEEGVQLLFGVEPVFNVLEKLRCGKLQELGQGPVGAGLRMKTSSFGTGPVEHLRRRLDIAMRSVTVGALKPHGECCPELWANQFSPGDFLRWAQANGWKIPEELVSLLDLRLGLGEKLEARADSLDPRERTTLLKIIAVFVKETKVDLAKPYVAAKLIQEMGARHGIELPQKPDTIANKLKDTICLLESQ
jgi:hypothetical protein